MKFTISENEAFYLHTLMVGIVSNSRRTDIESGLFRTASKLKHKTNRPGPLVSLGMKERKLIIDMLLYRFEDLSKSNTITPELEMIKGIVERVKI